MAGPLVRSGRYIAAAYEFVGALLGGAFFGWLADHWLASPPWGLLVGLLAGLAGGTIRLVTMLRRFERLDLERQP